MNGSTSSSQPTSWSTTTSSNSRLRSPTSRRCYGQVGSLLTNNVLVELPTTPMHAIGDNRVIYSDRPDDSDDIVTIAAAVATPSTPISKIPTPKRRRHPCKVGIGKASYDLNTRESGISRPGRSGVVSVVAVG